MYQWVEKRYWFFLVSAIVVFVGLVSIPFPPALRLGIDFTSGATLDITFAAPVSTSDLRQQMNELGFPEAIIQGTGEQRYFIRTRVLKEDVKDGSGNITKRSEKESIKDALDDGWRIIKFPEMALLMDESRTYGLGSEFIFEKWRS